MREAEREREREREGTKGQAERGREEPKERDKGNTKKQATDGTTTYHMRARARPTKQPYVTQAQRQRHATKYMPHNPARRRRTGKGEEGLKVCRTEALSRRTESILAIATIFHRKGRIAGKFHRKSTIDHFRSESQSQIAIATCGNAYL